MEEFTWRELLDQLLDHGIALNGSRRITIGGINVGGLEGGFNVRSIEAFLKVRSQRTDKLDADEAIRAAEEYLRQHRRRG